MLTSGDMSITIVPLKEWEPWLSVLDDQPGFFFRGQEYAEQFNTNVEFEQDTIEFLRKRR